MTDRDDELTAVADFHVETDDRGKWAVMRVRGELDVYTCPILNKHFDGLAEDGRHFVVADLAGVGFLDSSGLACLVRGLKVFRTRGGDLRVVTTRPNVLKMFGMTALDKIIDIFETADAACVSE